MLFIAGAANSASTTVSYQVSASSDDGFAQSATVQDITAGYLKIGDDNTYAVPYQMSAMRFNNVDTPRSATITSAYLKISSINTDYRGQIYGLIRAEAVDNPADFSARNISDAILTSSSVVWDSKTAWSPDTQYISPDISNVIQEVINRPGYNSGNSMAIYYSTRALSRKARSFASYEYSPSSAAVLEVTYETYNISGYVLTGDAIPLEGVIVTASADVEEDVTDATGYYELKVPPTWSGIVTASKIGWNITPPNRSYSNVITDQLRQDYSAFEVITVYAAEDSYVNNSNINTNYGMENGFSSGNLDGSVNRAYLKFILPDIPDDQMIVLANLHLNPSFISFPSPVLSTHYLPDDSWNEASITWSNMPSEYSPTPSDTIDTSVDPIVWTVTGGVEDALYNDGIYSVVLKSQNEQEIGLASFWSKDSPTPLEYHPYLETVTEWKYNGGDGSAENPYQIDTAEQLYRLSRFPSDWDKNFIMTSDINLSSYPSFDSIGYFLDNFNLIPFSGVFDGNGHIITGFKYSNPEADASGFFSYISGAVIKNLTLINCNVVNEHNCSGIFVGLAESSKIINCKVVTSTVSGHFRTGGMIGFIKNSFISDCSVDGGQVTSTYSYAGGLIGDIEDSYVIRSFSTATVFEMSEYSGAYGGLIGHAEFTTVSQCYATGNVTASYGAGGLVGHIQNSVFIEDCYATGDVESVDSYYTCIGGFIGVASGGCIIDNSYSTGHLTPRGAYRQDTGGFIGFGSASVNNSFWDKDTSGWLLSDGGIPKTTAEMQTMATFTDAGWDFIGEPNNGYIDIWGMPTAGGYPLLWWQFSPLPPLPEFSGGSGSPTEPFLISNAIDLAHIGDNPRLVDKHYKLTGNPDCDGVNLKPIGSKLYPFIGAFNGDNHTVYNLRIDANGDDYVGLFGYVEGDAAIMNISVVDANIIGRDYLGGLIGYNAGAAISNCICVANVCGNQYMGGLAGYSEVGPISDCQATSIVTGYRYAGGLIGKARLTNIHRCSSDSTVSSSFVTGGLAGYLIDSNVVDCCSTGNITESGNINGGLIGCISECNVLRCHSHSQVSGIDAVGGLVGNGTGSIEVSYADGNASGNAYVGGLIGSGYFSSGEVIDSYASGNVVGNSKVGGFAGKNDYTLLNCYSTGDISGIEMVGGFIGEQTGDTIYCYSTGKVNSPPDANYIGGFTGKNIGAAISCYWDIQTSGRTQSGSGTGKTTAEMLDKNTYIGWGCEPAWLIHDKISYPHLWWQGETGDQMTIPEYSGGSGESDDPFLISTPEQLNTIGLVTCHQDKSFKLVSDIDMNGIEGDAFNGIGHSYRNGFTGIFDGNGLAIRNLKIDSDVYKACGLFSKISGPNAVVMNLGIIDPNIYGSTSIVGSLGGTLLEGVISNCWVSGGNIRNSDIVGGLVGYSYGRIINCYSETTVCSTEGISGGLVGYANGSEIISCYSNCNVSGGELYIYVGGLSGTNEGNGFISNCSASGSVSGNNVVGGLVGINRDNAVINASYSRCTATGKKQVGGLVGIHHGQAIINCYAIGDVYADTMAGGLLGYVTDGNVVNCYAAVSVDANEEVGGFVGRTYNKQCDFSNCFWDTNRCPGLDGIGNGTDSNVVGLVTDQMQIRDTFVEFGWDFVGEAANGTDEIWDICDGINYPRLSWSILPMDFICPDGIDFADFAMFASAWRTQKGEFYWNSIFDISDPNDDIIDELDLAVFCERWLSEITP